MTYKVVKDSEHEVTLTKITVEKLLSASHEREQRLIDFIQAQAN